MGSHFLSLHHCHLQKEILKKMGNPIPQNPLYNHVKQLFERISPVMIDSLAVKALMDLIDDAVNGIGEICEKEDIPDPIDNGMKLLTVSPLSVTNIMDINRALKSDIRSMVTQWTDHKSEVLYEMTHYELLFGVTWNMIQHNTHLHVRYE